MSHTASRRRRNSGNKTHYRLAHVFLGPACRVHFLRTTDLTNHDDGLGLGIFLKGAQHGNKISAVYRVTTNTHRGGLPHAQFGHLLDRFVVECAGTGYHANAARRINV